ncbi:hypothetical protein ACHAXT_012408 [Thalassiosira profunda]
MRAGTFSWAAAVQCTTAFLLASDATHAFQPPMPMMRHRQRPSAAFQSGGTRVRVRALSSTVNGESTDVNEIDPAQLAERTTTDAPTFVPLANATVDANAELKLYPATPTFRECLAFTLPALGIYVCSPLAALGPASSISDSAPLPLLFLSIASTNLIAKAFSEKDEESLARVSRTAIGVGSACGVILAGLLYIAAGPTSVLYCSGASAGALAPLCTKYVAIRSLALPAVVITTIAQAVCIGTKDSRTPMISVALAGALNLLGDLVLVKCLGQGIAGAAWATSLSQIVSAGLLLRVLKKRGFLKRVEGSDTTATVKQLLKFIPFLFIMAVKIGWHNSCSATAASLGGVRAAAHTAVVSVAMLCMVLGDVGSSLSQAFLPPFSSKTKDGKTTFDMDAARPTI